MLGEGEVATVDLKYSVVTGGPFEVCFEPLGTTFVLMEGQAIYLRVPLEVAGQIEVVMWPKGIGVWVPNPGDDYPILNESGEVLHRL